MTGYLRLDPPLHVETAKGPGLCHVMIDYGPECDLHWVVLLEETGQIWNCPNHAVRAVRNWSFDRLNPEFPEKK